ncbi:MAG: hypothetical protein DRJ57_05430 [Thermoprotei archaeon]|nr:MAG: hypothetical protein DRJ57_05430 [Thermoprotei archaeon]
MVLIPRPALLLAVMILASSASCLPVAVKNQADVAIENYPVFVVVEREALLREGMDPASMCVVDEAGNPLPFWVVPQTLNTSRVAMYVLIPYLMPGEQMAFYITSGSCEQNPEDLFIFFDDFRDLDPRRWIIVSSPRVLNITVKARGGLYISGRFAATQQYLKVLSQPFIPPFTVDVLVTPLTGFDHDACLDVYILGTEGAHPSEARGAYIHAWGWGSPLNTSGTIAWYRVAGPSGTPEFLWDVTTWEEGGSSPVWEAGETFLFRISVCAEGVRYEVYRLSEEGLERILANWNGLGIANETVIGLGQECGGAYGFTQEALFHWIAVRPYVYPEPRVEVGVEKIVESPLEPILEFLSKPANQMLVAWGLVLLVFSLVFAAKILKSGRGRLRR